MSYAFEVCYKTDLLRTLHNGREISLKRHSAQDISRYEFLKDIEKLEAVVGHRPGVKGCAVLTTNDRNYWEVSNRVSLVDEDFRIHEVRRLHGELRWKNASAGTMENREREICLHGTYQMNWLPCLDLGTGKNGIFHMLVVEVG